MHDLLCRHTDDMIHKLESAGLGYHVKTDESDDRLGMNSSSSRFVSGLVIVREFSDLYSVCENMNVWWVHFWQKYIYEKHGICHSLIYKKAKFNLKMRTQCQLCLPTKRKELCFFSTGHIPLRHLVYRVHALPGSMRPLIWDFGQLNHQVEILYTNQIVSRYVSTWKVLLLLCLLRTN